MSRRRSRSSDGAGGAAFLLLVVIALIVKFIWWILGALALVAVVFVLRAAVREYRRRSELYVQRCQALAARADEQHNLVMQGDDRGVYGAEAARLMHFIRDEATPVLPPAPR